VIIFHLEWMAGWIGETLASLLESARSEGVSYYRSCPISLGRSRFNPISAEPVRHRDRWITNQRPRFYEARTIPNPRIQIQWLTRTGRNASIGAVQSQIDGRASITPPARRSVAATMVATAAASPDAVNPWSRAQKVPPK
jgi:hypothetical protein